METSRLNQIREKSMGRKIQLIFIQASSFLKTFVKDIVGHQKNKRNIHLTGVFMALCMVAIINIQFLKKRYPTEEPEDKKRKTKLFLPFQNP
jgi:hypothetical protein